MTASGAGSEDPLEVERARSAATLAALHDELDAATAERDRLVQQVAELTEARDQYATSADARATEIAALRDTRAVRWATRLRGALGR